MHRTLVVQSAHFLFTGSRWSLRTVSSGDSFVTFRLLRCRGGADPGFCIIGDRFLLCGVIAFSQQ